jgi:hypothetical protein
MRRVQPGSSVLRKTAKTQHVMTLTVNSIRKAAHAQERSSQAGAYMESMMRHKLDMWYKNGKHEFSYHKTWSDAWNAGEVWMKQHGIKADHYGVSKIAEEQYRKETGENS